MSLNSRLCTKEILRKLMSPALQISAIIDRSLINAACVDSSNPEESYMANSAFENALNSSGMKPAEAEKELKHGTKLECLHLIYKNGFDPKRAANSKYGMCSVVTV